MSKLREIIEKLANKNANCDQEDFAVDDYAGGNMDDAYELGCSDGEILLAKQLIVYLDEEYPRN